MAGFMPYNVTKNVDWSCRSTSSFVLKAWRRAAARDWTRCSCRDRTPSSCRRWTTAVYLTTIGWGIRNTYGLRGICYFFIEVECAAMDLHSGVFGGTVNEGMADLIWMMNQLVAEDGTILVEGLMDSVAPLTKEEEAKYVNIEFDVEAYRKDIGAPGSLMHANDKAKTLMARWRYPSLFTAFKELLQILEQRLSFQER